MVAEMITKIGIPSDAELFLRVIVASILGYMIGYERKNRDKSAGMRTHAIVALGAALMMVVSKYGFYDVEKVDSSRVAAQIVSGVGFLGAGVILSLIHILSQIAEFRKNCYYTGLLPDSLRASCEKKLRLLQKSIHFHFLWVYGLLRI